MSIKDAKLLYQMIKYQNEEFSKIEKWKEVNEQKNEELQKQNYFDQDKTYSLTIQKLQIVISSLLLLIIIILFFLGTLNNYNH